MKVNNFKNISRLIHLLDKHILEILSKEEVNDDKLSVLSDIRILYVEELNNLIRTKNTSDMFDKKYFETYKRKEW